MIATTDALSDLMEFDHVIHVHADGSVADAPDGTYAPDLHATSDADGQHTDETDPDLERQATDAGWSLECGWTGQHGYSGPCMDSSEYIGGDLARHILDTPGYWVAVAIYEDDGSDPTSWAVAYREVAA